MASITCENVSVEFPVFGGGSRSLKNMILRKSTGGLISKNSDDRIVVKALNGLTFRFDHGDRVGLIGHNGSGKTTLLRVLARIYEPTGGRLEVDGRISALLDVGIGGDPEASGYENIYLHGAVLGFSREEVRRRIPEIAEFTELGDYLHMPVRTYSAGMKLRLAFAVSTCVEPDILLLDELIGVGDNHFMAKAEQRMDALIGRSNIMVIATHSIDIIKRLCTKALLMEHGSVLALGHVDQVVATYLAR
jgi:ABC-2 type transport system ATP-binding protein/lipopolysaccharide transport system ATP-binding protein